jgi:hypothetical protein
MDTTDLGHLPRPLREALDRALGSLLDLHDTLLLVYSPQPTTPYPRSATELLCLEALTQIAPVPVGPRQLGAMIGKPQEEVYRVLLALEMLGTIYRVSKGNYSTVPSPLPPETRTRRDEPPRPSAQYAARIARIVAQGKRPEPPAC